ncbi:hypothetical protein F4679DRAFT_550966 [Xylaria curta]|nr:hypothetical protein F4679DRAFT_550966 [Xylaria curta]
MGTLLVLVYPTSECFGQKWKLITFQMLSSFTCLGSVWLAKDTSVVAESFACDPHTLSVPRIPPRPKTEWLLCKKCQSQGEYVQT